MTQYDVTIDEPLPQSPDAERAVLGSIIINNNAFYRVDGVVRREDFSDDAHRTIYSAIRELLEDGRDVDELTLREELKRQGRLEQVGGFEYVAFLTVPIPDITNVEQYARIVRRAAEKRSHVRRGTALMRRGMDLSEEPEETAAWELQQLTAEASGKQQARSMWEVVLDVERRRIEEAKIGVSRTIRTGFPTFDKERVLRLGAITIFAAPSMHGKSTLMRNAAIGAMRADAKQRVAFYSLEESADDFQDPLLSAMSGVRLTRIQDRSMNEETDRPRFELALEELKSWRERFHFADRVRDFEALHADCRRLKATSGLDVVFFDYLQLIAGLDEDAKGEQRMAAICRGLLRLAQDLDVSVCVGSQVNKEREKRSSGRLANHDMKYGAVIGEFAAVSLMWQIPRLDDKANDDIPRCRVMMQMEKNRGRLAYDPPMHVDMSRKTFAEGDCESNNCPRVTKKSDPQMSLR